MTFWELRKCIVCGKEFYAGENQHCCSAWCEERTDVDPIETSRNCERCQDSFVPKTSGHRFCCADCREKSYERNKPRGRFVIFERDGFACFYCGKTSYEDNTELHVDHLVPVFKEGKDMIENLVTSCSRCNLEKSFKLLGQDILPKMLEETRKRNELSNLDNSTIIKLVNNEEKRKRKTSWQKGH